MAEWPSEFVEAFNPGNPPRRAPEPAVDPWQATGPTVDPWQATGPAPETGQAPAEPRNPWHGRTTNPNLSTVPSGAVSVASPMGGFASPEQVQGFVMPTGAVDAPIYKSERKYPRIQNMKGRCLLLLPVEFRTEPDPFNQGKTKDVAIAVVTMLNGKPITHHIDADGEMTELAEPYTTNLPVVYYIPWFRVISGLKSAGGAAVVGIFNKAGKAYEMAPAPPAGHAAAARLLADSGYNTAVLGALKDFREYERARAENAPAPAQSPGPVPF
jgi:hypothetical protein